MKIVSGGGGRVGCGDYDGAWLADSEPAEPSPQEFRDGMQLVYAALLAGTVLLNKDREELAAFLHCNGTEAVSALGEEIAAARVWCEQLAASLRLLEARTLTAAMSLGARA